MLKSRKVTYFHITDNYYQEIEAKINKFLLL